MGKRTWALAPGFRAEMKKSTRKKPAVLSDELRSETMTVREVAHYLRCRHYFNVYWLVRQKALPGFRLGRDWRFRRSDVDEWITARQVQPAPSAAKKPDGKQPRKRKA
jgi:excisionase family DNA binding protein